MRLRKRARVAVTYPSWLRISSFKLREAKSSHPLLNETGMVFNRIMSINLRGLRDHLSK
jgi:hypothetical protein